ncbi:MAG: hypothetical protein KAT07_05080 [Calditrichia bacterium]|jgi:EAL domain-containing protein (putative c-di-GMP-specific phosphodiesterase class I)|nr:hypothetical protein [Calditrichia bacterium]
MKKIDERMIFVVNNEKTAEDNDLLHLEWAVVSQLDGRKTVRQIAENLALNPTEVEEIFKKLVSDDLLVLVNKPEENIIVPSEFIKLVNHEMTHLLGPVASVIIEDVMDMMRLNKENIDRRNLPNLLDLLTNQIDDPVKQIEFQKNIYPQIKQYILK